MKKNKISLGNLSKIVWKNIITILIMTILFGGLGILYANHKKHTDYESVRSMMTDHSYNGSSANEKLQADINLGKTYSKIIESNDVAKAAHKKLPKKLRRKYSSSQISSNVKADPVMQTTIIKVSAKANSAKDSAAIVNAVTDAATDKIPEKVPSAGKVSLFSKATADEAVSHTSPSRKKFALLGAAVGFLLGLIIAFSVTTWTKLI